MVPPKVLTNKCDQHAQSEQSILILAKTKNAILNVNQI
jgi:hypothetical protein